MTGTLRTATRAALAAVATIALLLPGSAAFAREAAPEAAPLYALQQVDGAGKAGGVGAGEAGVDTGAAGSADGDAAVGDASADGADGPGATAGADDDGSAAAGADGLEADDASAAGSGADASAGGDADGSTGNDGADTDRATDAQSAGDASASAGSDAQGDTGVDGAADADASDANEAASDGADGEHSEDEQLAEDERAADEPGADEPGTDADDSTDDEPRTESLRAHRGPLAGAPSAAAMSPLLAGFQPGYIISDSNMYDGRAMTAAQVQSFLDSQVTKCTIGDPDPGAGEKWGGTTIADFCLKDAHFETQTKVANPYCKAYRGAKDETAAEIITKVGEACGISQKVLLVRMQLEQSLVQDTWPSTRQYEFAMGWNCPDSGPNNSANCSEGAAGFSDQVYHSAWQLKVYKAFPTQYDPYSYEAYKTNTIQWNPNPGCGTSQVYIENEATRALYIYTPYRPNPAALASGTGIGDECSTYGNRNFYRFYKQWFGAPNSFFPDVQPGDKFYREISWMGESGLSTGSKTTDGRGAIYRPKDRVTREAMAAFLYRLAGASYEAPETSPFADMQPGDKFYREITWMESTGLSTGKAQPSGKPKYDPKGFVTREAMAAFIYRMEAAHASTPASSPFADVKLGDDFYREIRWMYTEGLSTGKAQPSGKPKYDPKGDVSREAMAAFIYRLEH